MARRARVGAEIQAKVSVDLSRFEAALADLKKSVREQIVDDALQAGGGVIKNAAISKAPGRFIVVEKMGGGKLGSGVGTGLMKKDIHSGGSYVVIGPDREHWYYRFRELGTKTHAVTKRKRTTRRQALNRLNLTAKEKKMLTAGTRPAMKFVVGGKTIFARQVRGFAAKPFMAPAVEGSGSTAVKAIGKIMAAEIEKVKR